MKKVYRLREKDSGKIFLIKASSLDGAKFLAYKKVYDSVPDDFVQVKSTSSTRLKNKNTFSTRIKGKLTFAGKTRSGKGTVKAYVSGKKGTNSAKSIVVKRTAYKSKGRRRILEIITTKRIIK
jgi:hypothetical protein